MQGLMNALISEQRNENIPLEDDYFGTLIGSWRIAYIDHDLQHEIRGEWHFSRILDGMAIQDVIVLPGFEIGTTLRVYNQNTKYWDIVYVYADKIFRLEAKKENGRIVLTDIENESRKWVFVRMEQDSFFWQDITVKKDGEWKIRYDLYAERM